MSLVDDICQGKHGYKGINRWDVRKRRGGYFGWEPGSLKELESFLWLQSFLLCFGFCLICFPVPVLEVFFFFSFPQIHLAETQVLDLLIVSNRSTSRVYLLPGLEGRSAWMSRSNIFGNLLHASTLEES